MEELGGPSKRDSGPEGAEQKPTGRGPHSSCSPGPAVTLLSVPPRSLGALPVHVYLGYVWHMRLARAAAVASGDGWASPRMCRALLLRAWVPGLPCANREGPWGPSREHSHLLVTAPLVRGRPPAEPREAGNGLERGRPVPPTGAHSAATHPPRYQTAGGRVCGPLPPPDLADPRPFTAALAGWLQRGRCGGPT